jgi:hypothetical protein
MANHKNSSKCMGNAKSPKKPPKKVKTKPKVVEPEEEDEEEDEDEEEEEEVEDPPEASSKSKSREKGRDSKKEKGEKQEEVDSGTRLSVSEFSSINKIIMDNVKTVITEIKPDYTAIITAALAQTSRTAHEQPPSSTAAADQLVLLGSLAGILRGFPDPK